MESEFQPVDVLRRVANSSRVVEGYRPVGESLLWRLSEQYWKKHGTRGFVDHSIPFASTSGGILSQDAAELLFINCQESRPEGTMAVLELCAGTGLFARLFLEAFRRICLAEGERFHEQLVYVVSDGSPATVERWEELGVFPGDMAIAVCGDARTPLRWKTASGELELTAVRAVFCNYGFDSLPAAIVRRGEQGPEEMCVRTQVTRDEALRRRLGDPAVEALREMAEQGDPALMDLADLLEPEAVFQPCEREYPFLREALAEFGDAKRVVLNYGAIQCLRTILPALDAGGFILFSDFGLVSNDAPLSYSTPQEFGWSRTMGLHFPLLAYWAETVGAACVAPADNGKSNLHVRMVLKAEAAATRAAFAERFGETPYRRDWEQARVHLNAGAYDEAKQCYESVLARYPRDWSLLCEVAEFLIRQVADFQAGLDLAKAALQLNPWYSTWIWNVYGDGYFGLQRFEEALSAYKVAEEMAPRDVRTQVNLSYAYAALTDHERALVAIARGFANDFTGEFRDRLREKQQQILGTIRAMGTDVTRARERRSQRMTAC